VSAVDALFIMEAACLNTRNWASVICLELQEIETN